MSSFTCAELNLLDDGRFCVVRDFFYHVGGLPSHHVIKIPAGFMTDLASSPRWLWFICPPLGKYNKAAALHDRLYFTGEVTRKEADDIFYEAMGVLGVAKLTRALMFAAVRVFGARHYKG